MLGPKQSKAALTLTELLCVIAIIGILIALYLGPIAKAFAKVKRLFSTE